MLARGPTAVVMVALLLGVAQGQECENTCTGGGWFANDDLCDDGQQSSQKLVGDGLAVPLLFLPLMR